MPKVIVVDGTPLIRKPDGISVYTKEIVQGILKKNKSGQVYALLFQDDIGDKLIKHPRLNWVVLPYKRRAYQSLTKYFGVFLPVDKYIPAEKIDLALYPNFFMWPLVKKALKKAVVIHDLAYLDNPESLSAKNRSALKRLVNQSLRLADNIVAVSEFTASRIRDVYNPHKKIIIAAPAHDKNRFNPKKKPEDVRIYDKYSLPKKYILSLGTLEPRKNITGMIETYRLLPEKLTSKYSLVLAGGKGWSDTEIIKSIESARNQDFDIVTPGKIADEDLPALYRQSSLFLFLSHYEGFGIPLLEAMACGVPTVVSGAVSEAAGSAGIITKSPAEAAVAIENVLTDKEIRGDLIKKGFERTKKYSWESSAQDILSLIE